MEKKKFNINLDDSAFTKEIQNTKPLFQPSSKTGQTAPSTSASTQPAPLQSAGQQLSYAQFIVQSKKHGPPPHAPSDQKEGGMPKVAANTATNTGREVAGPKPGLSLGVHDGSDGASSSSVRPGDQTSETERLNCMLTGDAEGEEGQGAGSEPKQVEVQRAEVAPSLGPKPVGSGNSIIVSPRQRGNPIIKFIRSVPWEFGEVVPDYVLGQTTCALFLSLRYHNLNPDYIHDRLKQLGQTFTLRVLLVQVDVKDPHHSLKELARIGIMADCTLILAWSPEEAGRYLETYKAYEKKPADLLKEQVEKNYLSKVTDCLTTVKSVNKTDTITLLSTFSSLDGIINASKEDLVLCPGLGPQKARRLYDVLHQPFLKSRKKQS